MVFRSVRSWRCLWRGKLATCSWYEVKASQAPTIRTACNMSSKLKNPGNSSFLNAVLQCFMNIRSLQSLLKQRSQTCRWQGIIFINEFMIIYRNDDKLNTDIRQCLNCCLNKLLCWYNSGPRDSLDAHEVYLNLKGNKLNQSMQASLKNIIILIIIP